MHAPSVRSHTVFQLKIKASRQLSGGGPRQQVVEYMFVCVCVCVCIHVCVYASCLATTSAGCGIKLSVIYTYTHLYTFTYTYYIVNAHTHTSNTTHLYTLGSHRNDCVHNCCIYLKSHGLIFCSFMGRLTWWIWREVNA